MASLSRVLRAALSSQVFVQGDMVVFGYGGFYEQPKGFGLDICYFHKSEFGLFRSRRRLLARIRAETLRQVTQGHMIEGFIPQLISRWKRLLIHEWHYDRAELMFQAVKTLVPSLRKHDDFTSYVKLMMPGRAFCTAEELEGETRRHLEHLTRQDPLQSVQTQQYLLFNYLSKALAADMRDLLGEAQGEALWDELYAACAGDPCLAESLEAFMEKLFLNPTSVNLLADWHRQYFLRQASQPEKIEKTLNKLKVIRQEKRLVGRAKRDILAGFADLPREVAELLVSLRVPLFVATGADLHYFRHFHEPGYLVHRETGTLQPMIGLGLCLYRRRATGGIFVTWGGRKPERVWHTLAEESTHFADGPVDRESARGGNRYSSSPAFEAAFAEDLSRYPNWQHSKVLGAREWGQILLHRRISTRRRARIQRRIEDYGAELDFLHYERQERMAETFAALPIIEKAVGGRLARKVLPSLFRYYDQVYLPGLKGETKARGR